MIEIAYRLRFLSDFHLGSGLGRGAADDVTYRDEHGALGIHGSTIRGIVRKALEDLLPCLLPGGDAPAVVEAVFGPRTDRRDALAARWHFSDAECGADPYLHQRTGSPNLTTREFARRISRQTAEEQVLTTRVSVDPRLRRAEDRRLFAHLDGARAVEFWGTITAVEAEPPVGQRELLELALLWARALGHGRRRGVGACRFLLEDGSARPRLDLVLAAFSRKN